MKKKRHQEILSIIGSNSVETQEELADLLREAGFTVTQATVSRDIRELNLTKIASDNNKQKYVSFAGSHYAPETKRSLIKDAVISADCAGNLLVIKTRTGMGMAVAVEIDELEIAEILGTIGSDDVVFCAIKTPENAFELKKRFQTYFS